MKKTLSIIALSAVAFAAPAVAQQMPAPRAMPRTPVSRQNVMDPHDVMPASREVQGQAMIIDGEKLRIADHDLRLFGIVPPQLAASYGPQARAALDALVGSQTVTCAIRDRDRDGRLLATCHNAAGSDMALELLKRGLAVTARGSIANTEVATSYLAAEQAAQNAKIGLWSSLPPAPVAVAVVTPPVSAPAPAAPEFKKDDKPAAPVAKQADTQEKTAAVIAAQQNQQQIQARLDDPAWSPNESAPGTIGFFERYQILIACVLMLTTALSVITAIWAQKRRDRLDEMKAVAASLRGELMAARSVCLGRAREITTDDEDMTSTWPRIRASLYQASVGRLGILGADLARHIASIYGQSSDYASLYSPGSGTQNGPKKHALEMLARHIENVLPILAHIEKTGVVPVGRPLAVAHVAAAVSYSSAKPTYRAIPRNTEPRAQEPAAKPQSVSEKDSLASADKEASVTIEAIAETSAEITAPQNMETSSIPVHAVPPTPLARASASLWDNVRGFLQNARGDMGAQTREPIPTDEYTEYAALIEEDMARYQYGETFESFDITPVQKKRG